MDIMRMALLQGCCRDLHESAGLLQSLDILRTTVTHTGAETAQQLEYGIFHAALVSHTAFNTFGNQFLRILFFLFWKDNGQGLC